MVLPTSSSRQVLAWSLPTLAFVLSILWYRRRHRKSQTDPGGTPSVDTTPGDLVLSTSADLDTAAAAASLYIDNKLIDNIVITDDQSEVIVNHSEISAAPDTSVKTEDIVVISSSLSVIELNKSESDQNQKGSLVVIEEEVEEVISSVVFGGEVTATPDSIMTEVEEQSSEVVANTEHTSDVSEVETPAVLSKISVDVVAKEEEEEEDDTKNAAHQPRDSANHSPAEAMLASPSMSNDSDTHSVGSNDSGKGGSDVTTPVVEEETDSTTRKSTGGKRGNARSSRRTSTSSRSSGSSEQNHTSNATVAVRPQTSTAVEASSTPVTHPAEQPCIYEFVINQQLVGRLIGKHGCFVQQIKNDTNSSIFVKRHPDSPKFKVCAIEGTQTDIEEALKLIRKKFPIKKYPSVTLERVLFFPPAMNYPLIPESLQMYLVECVNNDVILSSLVSAGHMFIQQPTHPTFPVLSRLIMSMTQCYSEDDSPTLPNPAPGIVCAAPSQDGWYRAEVIDVRTVTPEEGEEGATGEETIVCDIKFVDYGGFMTLPCSELRQIRTDFMMLPFQATECYLADVTSIDDEEGWSVEATQCVEELTRDQVLQAQVVGYAENCIPFVRLFSSVQGPMAVMVNEVLVHRGLAKYFDPVSA